MASASFSPSSPDVSGKQAAIVPTGSPETSKLLEAFKQELDAGETKCGWRQLVVEICEAQKLTAKDGDGSSSPFCVLEFDGSSMRSSVKVDDLNPKWNEVFTFKLRHFDEPAPSVFKLGGTTEGTGDTLEISIFTAVKAGGKKQTAFLGRVGIPISFYGETEGVVLKGEEPPAPRWFNLEKRGVFSHVTGQLSLRLSYTEGDDVDMALIAQAATVDPSDSPLPYDSSLSSHASYDSPGRTVSGLFPISSSTGSPSQGMPSSMSDSTSGSISTSGNQRKVSHDLVSAVEYVYVHVLEARSLNASNILAGYSNPYLQVSLGKHTQARTKVVPKEVNPIWNEVFALSLRYTDLETSGKMPRSDSAGATLELSVWSEEQFRPNDHLGAITVNLADAPRRSVGDPLVPPQWLKLEMKKSNLKKKGEIQVAIWIGTQADEHFATAWQSDTGGIAHIGARTFQAPLLWYLRVVVMEGDEIALSENRRLPDMIVRARVGEQRRQTEVAANKGAQPIWNESLILVCAEPFSGMLVLDLLDLTGPTSEEFIGQVRMRLKDIPKRATPEEAIASKWLNVDKGSKVFGNIVGRLKLRVCFEGGYHVIAESPNFLSACEASAPELAKPPIGQLVIGLVGAKNLPPMKSNAATKLTNSGTTDAYAVAKYGRQWVRTKTIRDTFNPRWNEQYTWDVHEPCTVITIALFDNRHVKYAAQDASSHDVPIGKIRVRLNTLEDNRPYTNLHPLLMKNNKGLVLKTGEIELAIRLTLFEYLPVISRYLAPPLPDMNYSKPFPEKDLEPLRLAAMGIVVTELGKQENALRANVVQFVLESDENTFTMRRIKANISRIKNVLGGIVAFFTWFGKVATWQNPVATIFVHLLYAALLYYPGKVFPAIFLCLALKGASNYRLRPQTPAFLDELLSQGEEEAVEEVDLDEAQAKALSKDPGLNPVKLYRSLREQYEKLKVIAAQVQTVLGVVASVCERINLMLSWRDPRASAMATCLFFIIAVVLYVVPMRPLLLVVGWWQIRHPYLRPDIPEPPDNFLGRLPSLADTIY